MDELMAGRWIVGAGSGSVGWSVALSSSASEAANGAHPPPRGSGTCPDFRASARPSADSGPQAGVLERAPSRRLCCASNRRRQLRTSVSLVVVGVDDHGLFAIELARPAYHARPREAREVASAVRVTMPRRQGQRHRRGVPLACEPRARCAAGAAFRPITGTGPDAEVLPELLPI